MLERCRKASMMEIDFGKAVIARSAPCCRPGCLVERIVGLIGTVLEQQRYAEVVIRLAVVRVRIARSQPRDRRAEIALRQCEFTAAKMHPAQRTIDAAVLWIAAQRLPPV